MAEQKNTRLERQQLDAIEDMAERDIADNESEAHRMLLNAGMKEYGYQNGEHTDTFLKFALNRLGIIMTVAGMVGLAFTFAYPVPTRVPSFAVLMFGAGLYAASELLEDYEPAVTNKIKGLFGGETA